MRAINEIIIHHSATQDGATVSWQGIRRYHRSYRYNGQIITPELAAEYISEKMNVTPPWVDIGYHVGIEQINDEIEVLLGRPLAQAGAHTLGHNANSIGICVVGNYDLIKPDINRMTTTARVVAMFIELFNLDVSDVHAHNEFADKTCAGLKFDMDELKGLVEGFLP